MIVLSFAMELNQVIQGDCLEVMDGIPDSSIDLIATDPPFFKVKGGGSKGKFEWWDRAWDNSAEFLRWIDQLAAQWQRILKPNGSLYCFASTKMSAQVEVLLSDRFNVLNNIRWRKEQGRHKASCKEILRGYFPASESIIFCEHYGADNAAKGAAGYQAKCDELRGFVFEPLRAYLDGERTKAKIAHRRIIHILGMRGHDSHFFSPIQWKLPLEDQYKTLQDSFPGYFQRPYEELRQQYEELCQQYEELRRPFIVSSDVPYTDIWDFPTVQSYPGKHPCEKPLTMMAHIINASSKPNSVVLDCFCGSGNTLVAAKKHGRHFIGIDIDPHWADVARGKVGKEQSFVSQQARLDWLKQQTATPEEAPKKQQLSLLDLLAS